MIRKVQYNSDHIAIFDDDKLLFRFTVDDLKKLNKILPLFTKEQLINELCLRDGVVIHPTPGNIKCKSLVFTKETWDHAIILVCENE